jgi:hypothetical protein
MPRWPNPVAVESDWRPIDAPHGLDQHWWWRSDELSGFRIMNAVRLQIEDLPEGTGSRQLPLPHLVASPPTRCRLLRLLDAVSLAGLTTFVTAILALHGLRPDFNPAEHTISEYSLGSYGWLMRAAFCALGFAALATAVRLRLRFEPKGWPRAGRFLLGGMAVGLFLDAAFNTDRLHVPETVNGAVHSVGTWTLALTLPAAAFILGSHYRRMEHWISTARWLQLLSGAQIVAIVAFEISPNVYRGLAERMVTLLAVATMAVLHHLASARIDAWAINRRMQSLQEVPGGDPVADLSPVSTMD